MPEQERDAASATPGRATPAEALIARPTDERTAEDRAADHAAIDRLADELLPSLVARLGASGLGELEVREGDWRVRLRRPAGAERRLPPGGRAAPGRAGSKTSADDAHGRESAGAVGGAGSAASGSAPGTRSAAAATDRSPSRSDPEGLPPLTAVVLSGDVAPEAGPAVATAPAVGVYRAKPDLRSGARVRAGDRLGSVDVLGVSVEVVAPLDGIVAASLVDDGDGVEYGQSLVALEPLPSAAGGGSEVASAAGAATAAPSAAAGPSAPAAPPATSSSGGAA